jgi:hypothetical protein
MVFFIIRQILIDKNKVHAEDGGGGKGGGHKKEGASVETPKGLFSQMKESYVQLMQRLKKGKVGLLIMMAAIMTLLVLLNMAVTLLTAPTMEAFKDQADEWASCVFDVNANCGEFIRGVNCGYESCKAHSDCSGRGEGANYCDSSGLCQACSECHSRRDGIDGSCPNYECRITAYMNPLEICLYNYCAAEVTDCVLQSDLDCVQETTDAMLSGVDNADVGALLACARENGCQDQPTECWEAFTDNPACDCMGTEDIPRFDGLLSINNVGCYAIDFWELEMDIGFNFQHSFCYVKDPENCPLTGLESPGADPHVMDDLAHVYLGPQDRTGGLGPPQVVRKNGCCTEKHPQVFAVQNVCEFPSERPEPAVLSLSFLALNLVPCVAGAVFGHSQQFIGEWNVNRVRRATMLSRMGFSSGGQSHVGVGEVKGGMLPLFFFGWGDLRAFLSVYNNSVFHLVW